MIKKLNNIDYLSTRIGVTLYFFISILILFYNHHYYDDESWNILWITYSYDKMLNIIYSFDVHPPLSYIINKIIYELTGSYKAILLFSVLINIMALGYFYDFARSKLKDQYAEMLLFLATFLNGGILMWTNSMRWYAYWVPLFIILYTYLLRHQKLNTKHVVILSFILVLMTYINYLTFLVLIALFILFISIRRYDLSVKNIFLFFSLYLSLAGYQIYIFLTVSINNSAGQMSSLLNATLNTIFGVLNGGSVFIANPLFIFSAILTGIIILFTIKGLSAKKQINDFSFKQSFIFLIALLLLVIISGLGGKYRNVIAFSIPFYFIVSYGFIFVSSVKLKRIYLAIFFLLSILSSFNLITHTDTAKVSYNKPINQLKNILADSKNKVILTYDPAIYNNLKLDGYKVYFLVRSYRDIKFSKDTEIYLLTTYQGALTTPQYEKINILYNKILKTMYHEKSIEIGYDKYYKIKNLLLGNAPKMIGVEVLVKHGIVKENFIFNEWESQSGGEHL